MRKVGSYFFCFILLLSCLNVNGYEVRVSNCNNKVEYLDIKGSFEFIDAVELEVCLCNSC